MSIKNLNIIGVSTVPVADDLISSSTITGTADSLVLLESQISGLYPGILDCLRKYSVQTPTDSYSTSTEYREELINEFLGSSRKEILNFPKSNILGNNSLFAKAIYTDESHLRSNLVVVSVNQGSDLELIRYFSAISTSNSYYSVVEFGFCGIPSTAFEVDSLKLSNLEVGFRPFTYHLMIYFRSASNIQWSYSALPTGTALNANGYNALQNNSDLPIEDESATSIYTPGGTSVDPHNPYPGGSSGSNPGTNDPLNSGTDTTSTSTPGTWELPFDEVPDTPATVHSVDLGLYNVYALSAAQVKELANYLFSGVTELGENLVKLIWGSKRDVIISLYEFPLMVTTQGTDTIRFIFDTDLAGLFHGKQLTSEYIPIDFGTIKVDRYSGTFYDFEPYTTLTLYIPYIGYIDLKPTEVVGSTLSIRGYVHLTTGELNVNVRSSRTGILGSYSGTIGRLLPIADADATDIYASIIKTAASLGAVALAGAGMATASRVAAGISTPNKQTVDSARDTYMQSVGAWGSATRGVRGREASMLQAQGAYEKAQADYAEQSSKYNAAQSAVRANREDFHDSASDAISNSLDAVTTGFGVSRGTVMTSSNGRVSPQRCFLRIEVPHQNVSRQQKILGYPANTSDALNSDRLHGYTELRTIELSIPNATLTEIQELEDILRGGFYLP